MNHHAEDEVARPAYSREKQQDQQGADDSVFGPRAHGLVTLVADIIPFWPRLNSAEAGFR